jgi:hypothetical protein
MSPYAAAANNSYAWCSTTPVDPGIYQSFYSRVFAADASDVQKIQNAFAHYVQVNYPKSNTGPAVCNFRTSREAAEGDLRLSQDNGVKVNQREVIDTGWSN